MNIDNLKIGVALCLFPIIAVCASGKKSELTPLKEAFKGKFLIGVALNTNQFREIDTKSNPLILSNFNSIVAENCMKSEVIQPIEGQFDFERADQFVRFGEKYKMIVIGHTLIWHSQAPKWFFEDKNGAQVTKDVLIERMKSHIFTVVKRYKGRIKGWDVVNEAINDDGSFRESPFYKIIGKEYIKLAFQFAHQADPNAELYYNDYSMALPGRRRGVVEMVKELQLQGIQISGIGMQGHLGMDFPTVEEFEKSLVAFSNLGVKVMITEMDLSVLPSPWAKTGANISDKATYQEKMNPYSKGVPAEINAQWEKIYSDFFKMFIKHKDKIDRVTLWGVSDNDSWKNDWPIKGRTDYPLLFDRNYQPKPVVKTIIELAKKDKK